MEDRKAFGIRIKAVRESRNITVEKAAEFCDASESIWKQYEKGDRLPSLSKFIKMCVVLRVKPEYLFGPELDEMKDDIDEIERLKNMIEQLHPDDVSVIHAAVSKRLEIMNRD